MPVIVRLTIAQYCCLDRPSPKTQEMRDFERICERILHPDKVESVIERFSSAPKYLESEMSQGDPHEFAQPGDLNDSVNNIRNTNDGKSQLLKHWIGFSADSVERVKRGQSMIALEAVKLPVAKRDNRPSLWGLNVASEAQESARQAAIPKAVLRRKLDHYYEKQIAEQNRILKAKARAKAAALLASKSRSSMMKPMGSQQQSSTSQPRFKQTQVIATLRRSHQSGDGSEPSRSPPRLGPARGLTVELPARKPVQGRRTMPRRGPTVVL